MLLLWISLVLILGRASYRTFTKQKKIEGWILIALIALIVLMTGEYALYFAWSIGCWVTSMPMVCME